MQQNIRHVCTVIVPTAHRARINSRILLNSLVDGPRKNAIESLQKQIDFYLGGEISLKIRSEHSQPCLPSAIGIASGCVSLESSLQDDARALSMEPSAFSRLVDVGTEWPSVSLSFGVGGSQVLSNSKHGHRLYPVLDRRFSHPPDVATSTPALQGIS